MFWVSAVRSSTAGGVTKSLRNTREVSPRSDANLSDRSTADGCHTNICLLDTRDVDLTRL